jgi:type I restriction enzyme, S subunit
MKSDWVSTSLGFLVDVKQGLAINAKTKHLIVDKGSPLLRITDLLNGTQVQFINASEAPTQCLASVDDLIYTRTGQVGHVFRGKEGVVHNNCFRIIPKNGSVTRGYLYWFLFQNSVREYANNIASGSVQKDLNHSAFKSIQISIPPRETQLKIEKVLNSLDDKIELNRKMNQTLEEMAQALFKSWFVDFDPVHAKANTSSDADFDRIAKELGISREILDFFPNEFEESELGMIPKGWNISKINEKLDVLLGGTPSRSNDSYWKDGTVSWINSGKVNEFRVIQSSEMITGQAVRDSSTKLLPKKTTLLAITGATLGQVSLLEIDSCANQSVIGLPETEELNHAFVYPCVCHIITDLISHQTGGAQQHINKGNVENYKIIIPKKDILSGYTDLVEPLMSSISNNTFEVQSLQATRDTLLLKLLSGELDVSELELDHVTH